MEALKWKTNKLQAFFQQVTPSEQHFCINQLHACWVFHFFFSKLFLLFSWIFFCCCCCNFCWIFWRIFTEITDSQNCVHIFSLSTRSWSCGQLAQHVANLKKYVQIECIRISHVERAAGLWHFETTVPATACTSAFYFTVFFAVCLRPESYKTNPR